MAESPGMRSSGTVGRPRHSGQPTGSPREDIINCATRLFTDKGYAETTMSEIARAAGLRQSSLYYWFARKEQILQALLEDNRGSLRMARRMEPLAGDEAARLYAILYSDVLQLCLAPLDFYEFEHAARQQPESFGSFFDDYAELHRLTAAVIRQGRDAGALRPCDPAAMATAALSLNEGLQRRHRQPAIPGAVELTPPALADLAAQTSVAALLADPAALAAAREKAQALAADTPAAPRGN